MSKATKTVAAAPEAITVNFKISTIELLRSVVNAPETEISVTNCNFNIHIQSKIDEKEQFIFIVINVDTTTQDNQYILGSVTTSCIYKIINFEDVIIRRKTGELEVPENLAVLFNSISLSTTRGIMFSAFRGTFLHGAILPVVNPSEIKLTNNKEGLIDK